MSVAVITTSINSKPSVLLEWASQCDRLIVAGDQNSPPELSEFVRTECGGKYLTPEMQEPFEISAHVGWRSIQRRNFALLWAIREGHDYVVTVDDDNSPSDEYWIRDAMDVMDSRTNTNMITPSDGFFFDPGSLIGTNARGLPYEIDRAGAGVLNTQLVPGDFGGSIGVFQGMALGDPDIDAITRMANAPVCEALIWPDNVSPSVGVWSPLNSQSTMWNVETAPLCAVLPHVGRMDDIWGGYIAERILHQLGQVVAYGAPVVWQLRNEHNLVKDLKQEILGYEFTLPLIDFLSELELDSGADILDSYGYIASELGKLPWFPKDAIHFMHAWMADVEEVRPA